MKHTQDTILHLFEFTSLFVLGAELARDARDTCRSGDHNIETTIGDAGGMHSLPKLQRSVLSLRWCAMAAGREDGTRGDLHGGCWHGVSRRADKVKTTNDRK